ncbi:WbqC family protein [Christiangramia sabulilitoris]|uniref:WbqC family protein n=1 Tax=Christiangramia sabulilitoris TaxID=2583991 RepID=A0A550I7D8_9FLAO|nr:WbqC family protein [Christiangramia sabulilitoris]TRO66871.1 WbqC family protein [Christiangramia sabulilitoris]
MMPVLLHPSYFGPISQWTAIAKAEKVIFENEDNYQKQTYRNRMYIYDANGRLTLNIPIKHSSALGLSTKGHQKYKEVQIENDFSWQLQHWRAFKASYQTSPFFEFYEDELYPLYSKEYKYLMDFNYDCMEFAADCLQLEWEFYKTEEFILEPLDSRDLRNLVNAKSNQGFENTKYNQVFEEKSGFLPNLSILDLIFNEGNAALDYLLKQEL